MITRRSFVLSTVATGLTARSDRASSVQPPKQDSTTPEAWYSSEDGEDWRPAFERAQENASTIRLGPRVYELGRAVINQSHRTWIGEGNRTIVRNIRDPRMPAVIHCAFMMGNMHPAAFGSDDRPNSRLPVAPANGTRRGDRSVRLSRIGDATAFRPGLAILLRTSAEAQGDGYMFPKDAQFNVVQQVERDEVKLVYPCLEDIADACVSPIDHAIDPFMSGVNRFTTKWGMVENVHLRNLGIEADYITSTRTGMFGCSVADVSIRKGKAALAINAAIKCEFSRIQAIDCTDRILEVKCFSDTSRFSDIQGNVIGSRTPHNIVIDIGERSNHIHLSRIKAKKDADASSSAIFANEGSNNVLEDFAFEILGCPENYTPMYLFSSRLGRATGSVIRNGVLKAPPQCARHLQVGGGGGSQPVGYAIDHVAFEGVTRMSQSVWIAGGGRDGVVSNCRFPYAVRTEPGAVPPRESGNLVTG